MSNKLLTSLVAAALATTLAFASPALARGGGGGGHGGGMGGGMHGGGMGGGGWHGGGAQFGGRSFAGARFAHPGFSPRSSRFAFHDRRFFDHRHRRFAFIGSPYGYGYDDCWRSAWTSYGLRWVNVCGGYGYY